MNIIRSIRANTIRLIYKYAKHAGPHTTKPGANGAIMTDYMYLRAKTDGGSDAAVAAAAAAAAVAARITCNLSVVNERRASERASESSII